MTICAVCETDIDATTTAYAVTEFGPLGVVSITSVLCSPGCFSEFADRIELAVEGGATS